MRPFHGLYVQVQVDLREDPDFIAFAAELRAHLPAQFARLIVEAQLVRTWSAFLRHAPGGCVDHTADDTIEAWAGWDGERGVFAAAFRQHWCKRIGDSVWLRGWNDRYGQLADRRAAAAEKKRRQRSQSSTTPQSNQRPSLGTRRSRGDNARVSPGTSANVPGTDACFLGDGAADATANGDEVVESPAVPKTHVPGDTPGQKDMSPGTMANVPGTMANVPGTFLQDVVDELQTANSNSNCKLLGDAPLPRSIAPPTEAIPLFPEGAGGAPFAVRQRSEPSGTATRPRVHREAPKYPHFTAETRGALLAVWQREFCPLRDDEKPRFLRAFARWFLVAEAEREPHQPTNDEVLDAVKWLLQTRRSSRFAEKLGTFEICSERVQDIVAIMREEPDTEARMTRIDRLLGISQPVFSAPQRLARP